MAPTATYQGHWDGPSAGSVVTSAPIPVNAGEFLVVTVEADGSLTSPVVSTSVGWGFPYRVDHNEFSGSDGCYTGIFGVIAPSTASPTITVTMSGGASNHRRPSIDVWTVAGVDPGSPLVTSNSSGYSGNPFTVGLRSSPGAGDTLAIICGADVMKLGAPYVSAGGGIPGPGFDQPGSNGISGFSTAATWATPDAYYTVSVDQPGSSFSVYSLAWFEIRKAVLPPAVNAGADATINFPGPFNRTATETAYSTITARGWTIQSGPAGAGTTIGTAAALSWTPPQAGTYVLRYSATNSVGTGTDDVTVTVNAVVPAVDAYIDRTVERTKGIIRTATEVSSGGAPITARQWRLMSGPAGSGAPMDLPAYGGDPMRVLLPNDPLGTYVIRYTATNSAGAGYDEATITVIPLRPTVNAGPDEARGAGLFTRTAQETAGDSPIISRQWIIQAGPTSVGTVIGTAATLSWTPPSLGQWTLRYTATSTAGTSDPDDTIITIGVTGATMHLGRVPEPKIAVSIAFAGDLTDPDGSAWAFTEVTSDVRVEQGLHLRHGRSDEASTSQPAQCLFTLDNRSGMYSLGGRSPYWPNVRQGAPIQVSVDLGDGAGFRVLFTGFADGFTPRYSPDPQTGTQGDATVAVSASGALRRLSQGTPPVISPFKRGMLTASGVCAYWPCEDDKASTNFASAFPSQPPMEYAQRLHAGSNPNAPAAIPRPAASDLFLCSQPLPLISDSEWYGNVLPYTVTNNLQAHFMLNIPAAGSNTDAVLIGVVTTGDPYFWEIRYRSGGQLNIRAWRTYSPYLVEDRYINFGVDGKLLHAGFTLTQNGSAVDYKIDTEEVGNLTTGLIYTNSVAGSTLGMATRVQTATDGGHFDVTMGHVSLRNVAFNLGEYIDWINGWAGDQVGERFLRITGDTLLGYTQLDGDVPYDNITDWMGPQRPGTIVQLLRDCEACDTGTLWDGKTPGITYTTKRYRESRPPALILDVSHGEVAVPFDPVHDDQARVNRAVASRRNGASASYIDNTGPLGANIVGRYDDSREVDCRDDTALPQYASWMVFQGTCEGYRYPRLSLDLRAHPELLDEWLALSIGDRIDVLNVAAVAPSAPVETLSLLIEGYEQTITPYTWEVLMNTSLARRWQVAQFVATTTGGASDPRAEYAGRFDTDGTVIATLCTAGQSSITVNTPSGPLWTTNSDDYPLYLDIGAVRVQATACSAGGVSGNLTWQTFTTEPLPVSRPAGTAVQLWQPPVLGL